MNKKMKPLRVSDGSLEALKWLALVLMTVDHVNKYLFNGTIDWMFATGRLCLPIFVFVLAYNLARPGTLERGAFPRTMTRMALFGAAASVPFIALGGLGGGWWPLNILFTLLVITATLYLVERGGVSNLVAAGLVFLAGGSVVEYWWPAIILGLAAWSYSKNQTWAAATITLFSLASLWIINRNFWALAALPLILVVSRLEFPMPRLRFAFYAYYPIHLAVLWMIRIPMGKAGYLFL